MALADCPKPLKAVCPSGDDVLRRFPALDGVPDGIRAPHQVERVPAPICRELQAAWIQTLDCAQDVHGARCGSELPCVSQDQSHTTLWLIPRACPDRFKPYPG